MHAARRQWRSSAVPALSCQVPRLCSPQHGPSLMGSTTLRSLPQSGEGPEEAWKPSSRAASEDCFLVERILKLQTTGRKKRRRRNPVQRKITKWNQSNRRVGSSEWEGPGSHKNTHPQIYSVDSQLWMSSYPNGSS